MPYLRTMTSKTAFASLTILLAASIGLTACGGSSSSTSTPAAANAPATTTPGGATTGGATSSGAPAAGAPTPSTGGASSSGTTSTSAPSSGKAPTVGTPRAGTATAGIKARSPARVPPALSSPRVQQAFARFAACMRQNGINLSNPNTTGRGPLFDTKGIDTTGPQFKAAAQKCRAALLGGRALRSPKTGAGG